MGKSAAIVAAWVIGLVACTSSSDGGGSTSSSSSGGSSSGASGSSSGGGDACASDPLKTNLAPLFNGNDVDAYDCFILTATAKYGEPDAMIFKAIIYVESRFQNDAVGCTSNTACCPAKMWTDAECGCLGVMQTGPDCNGTSALGLLANGHVDMSKDPTSADWAGSVFNPQVNIELGVKGINGNRAQVKKQFAGCTEDQYTMMAIGNFNSYGSTKSCTDYNKTYDDEVLKTYAQYATASGWKAHAY